jgi:hypothetical protein
VKNEDDFTGYFLLLFSLIDAKFSYTVYWNSQFGRNREYNFIERSWKLGINWDLKLKTACLELWKCNLYEMLCLLFCNSNVCFSISKHQKQLS